MSQDAATDWRALADRIASALDVAEPEGAATFVRVAASYAEPLLEDGDLEGSTTLLTSAAELTHHTRGLRSALHRRRLAIHEAAHAVVGLALGLTPSRATLRPRAANSSAASVAFDPPLPNGELAATVYYAGDAGNRFAGDPFNADACSSDYEEAARTIRRARGDLGEVEERAFLHFCQKRSVELTRRYWPAVEAVAKALVQHETLDGAMIAQAARAAMPTAAWPSAPEAA